MAKIEVFIAGCPLCEPVVQTVKETACPNCEITIYNLQNGEGKAEAERYGVTRVPTVVVNGSIAACCQGTGAVSAEQLRAAGVGGA
jgi:alkyl hydroperoxide reductase subunit AhpF